MSSSDFSESICGRRPCGCCSAEPPSVLLLFDLVPIAMMAAQGIHAYAEKIEEDRIRGRDREMKLNERAIPPCGIISSPPH